MKSNLKTMDRKSNRRRSTRDFSKFILRHRYLIQRAVNTTFCKMKLSHIHPYILTFVPPTHTHTHNSPKFPRLETPKQGIFSRFSTIHVPPGNASVNQRKFIWNLPTEEGIAGSFSVERARRKIRRGSWKESRAKERDGAQPETLSQCLP